MSTVLSNMQYMFGNGYSLHAESWGISVHHPLKNHISLHDGSVRTSVIYQDEESRSSAILRKQNDATYMDSRPEGSYKLITTKPYSFRCSNGCLASFPSLPTYSYQGEQQKPGGDTFRPCREYVPYGRLLLAFLCFLSCVYCAHEGARSRLWLALFYALYVVVLSGLAVLLVVSGHRYDCNEYKRSDSEYRQKFLHDGENVSQKHLTQPILL